MNIPEELQQREDYQACVSFHGHTCMGLTLGYLASRLALKTLREDRSIDEELVCVTETDACCCDAIQVLTGCTFGKGNLLYDDIGKMAFTFASRTTGEGIRITMRPGVMDAPAEEKELLEKIRSGDASSEEIKIYETMNEERSSALFKKGAKGFFKVEDANIPLPDKARIAPSVLCDMCNEPVMMTKLQQLRDKKYCRHCLKKIVD